MTIPANDDNDAYVKPGGSIILQVMFETWLGSGVELGVSGIQITITPALGGAAVLGPASDGIVTIDQATYQYRWLPPASTPPADYIATWTVTGPPGTPPITQSVRVVAPPAQTPEPGLYATVAQYRTQPPRDSYTPDWRVEDELALATMVIDNALIGAVYPTDANELPTVAAHIDLFMRATVAQAKFQLANFDPEQVKSQYASTSMGGVSQTRTLKAQGQVMPPLAPRAAIILRVGGVLPGAPLISW